MVKEAKIQHAAHEPHYVLVAPLYHDIDFHQQFLEHDMRHGNVNLVTFLKATGASTSIINQYARITTPRSGDISPPILPEPTPLAGPPHGRESHVNCARTKIETLSLCHADMCTPAMNASSELS